MRALARALIVAAVVLFGLLFAQRAHGFWIFTLDDAFITLRYAKHAAAALGPAWNVGGAAVEGYTTALWLALLALGQALGLPGVLLAKSAGVVFAALATCCAALLATTLAGLPPEAAESEAGRETPLARAAATATPFVMAAAYWPWPLHAVSGMETTLAGLLLTLLFWLSVRAQTSVSLAPRLSRALALSALLATLTRPEAALACAVCLALTLLRLPSAGRRSLGRALVGFALLPGALYFGWRLWRYQLLLPLSFYVKSTGQEPLAGLADVGEFFLAFVRDQPLWGALAVLGAARRVLWPALAAAAALAIFFVFPAHIMAFEGRYLMPLFPFLSALAGAGAARVLGWLAARAEARGLSPHWLALPGSLVLALALWSFPSGREERAQPWLDYGAGLREAHMELGRALERIGGPEHSIALLDVGAVGYLADWFTIDTFGLNDPHVALTRRRDVDYVLDQQPELLVVVSTRHDRYEPLFDWELPLYREATQRGYAFVCSYRFDPAYHLWVLARAPALGMRACSARARRA
jgi:arabinofuranosyltransferase